MSNSEVYLTRDEIEHPYANLTVMLEDKRRKVEQMSKTVFARITVSPEVLAEKLVYLVRDSYNGAANYYWCSTVADDGMWRTKQEAITATVAKLKGVVND